MEGVLASQLLLGGSTAQAGGGGVEGRGRGREGEHGRALSSAPPCWPSLLRPDFTGPRRAVMYRGLTCEVAAEGTQESAGLGPLRHRCSCPLPRLRACLLKRRGREQAAGSSPKHMKPRASGKGQRSEASHSNPGVPRACCIMRGGGPGCAGLSHNCPQRRPPSSPGHAPRPTL